MREGHKCSKRKINPTRFRKQIVWNQNINKVGIFFYLNLWGFLWCGAGLMRLVFEIFDRVLEK
ncbi:hypothetical protein NC652_019184 [Populus alba x Populus x berolinensis]|uniref:Uncharacterized protein n=1 Tax=Populus alba x Populus x berolinensis TaxID=444605 RepID=A0AAD6QJW7_9ROSI|nr:hypothetical protein NC652_019184 [Populus alba x Populus x berolinensis]KAJ6991720.1 hypothetical protein NC653_019781 [Populus alba x Populus x berolinensis]